MPLADKCHLNIPFKNFLASLQFDEEGRVDPASLKLAQQREFENYKAIERRMNDPACRGITRVGGKLKPLTVDGSTTDATDYTTQLIALDAKKLYLAFFTGRRNSGALGTITATQTGATWTSVNFSNWGDATNPPERTYIFRCQPTANVAAAGINFDAPTTSIMTYGMWAIVEFENAYDDSANNGAACIIQSNTYSSAGVNETSKTLTMGALTDLNNLAVGVFGVRANSFIAPGAGAETVALVGPYETDTMLIQQRRGVFELSATWTASQQDGCVICEVKMID